MTTAKNPNRKNVKDNDFDLIQSINSGQVDKFHDLVKRYEQNLYNFGLRMCRDHHDAEDMVQETFLNVFKYLKDFRYESKFKNWLYKVAASTCIKKRRKSKFAPEKELSLDEFRPSDDAEPPDHVVRFPNLLHRAPAVWRELVHPGGHLLLEAADALHEELIENRPGDRDEFHPLE